MKRLRSRSHDGRPEALDHGLTAAEWYPPHGMDRMAVIEEDTADLIRQVVAGRQALERAEQEHEREIRRLLLDILDVVDAFDRVLANINERGDEIAPEIKPWVGNVRSVYRLLERSLSDREVSAVAGVAEVFDPDWHDVVDVVDDPSRPAGEIVRCDRRGYRWRGQLLRRADVVVVRSHGA